MSKHRDIHFSCTGCGVCCKTRLIPLSLQEARQWLERGNDVSIILEAFHTSAWIRQVGEFDHALSRSIEVSCGNTSIQVISILAGIALEQCPNLASDNSCEIYNDRPLACQIYPLEVNPFIEFSTQNKARPPVAWDSKNLIFSNGYARPDFQALIAKFRNLDISECRKKIQLAQALGLNIAAWKGEALAIYLPSNKELLRALQHLDTTAPITLNDWQLKVESFELQNHLITLGAKLADETPSNYIHHKL